jgi:hypothetical protein
MNPTGLTFGTVGPSSRNALAFHKRRANAEERAPNSTGAGGAGGGESAQAGQGIAGLYSQMFGSSAAAPAPAPGPGIASMVSQFFGQAPGAASAVPPMEPAAPELTGAAPVDERNYYEYVQNQLLPYLRTYKSTNSRIVPLETALRDFKAREAANREFGGGGKRRKHRKYRKSRKTKKTKKVHHRR